LAMDAALSLSDASALRKLCEGERVWKEVRPVKLWLAAKVLHNKTLLLRALFLLQWQQWMQTGVTPIAFVAAFIWYAILLAAGSREPWRWLRYMPAVGAGVASVWLLQWWQGTLNYHPHPQDSQSMTQEIVHWVLFVGIPEEAAKLCCFAFFLPVLLHRDSDTKAALTAGCVGLGFALDENMHYFLDYGTSIALGRLLTANMMHVLLTGLVGWHFYHLCRSRFHSAGEFLTAFIGAAAAHGIYNFSSSEFAAKWGFDVVGVIILAFGTRLYFAHLQLSNEALKTTVISRTSVFCVGSAVLTGILINAAVWEQRDLMAATGVLKDALGLAVVGLFYIREFREV
ncbi:MAG: PrsW family glutamic-type intramembrane protease, partial [Roseimicrobium sp.]